MSLAWRILLFALVLNVMTVGVVQVVVHGAQQRWFLDQREMLSASVQESLAEVERIFAPSALLDVSSNARAVRQLLRNRALRELYEDVILSSGRPPYEGLFLNVLGAVNRDPESFPQAAIVASFDRAREVDGLLPVADGYCRALRREGAVVGYLWYRPRHAPRLPSSLPLWTSVLGVLASTVLFGGVLFWVARRAVRQPLQAIGAAAEAVARGDYGVRLPEMPNAPELAPLVVTFNQMAAQVEQHTGTLAAAVRRAVEETERRERALVQSSRLATIGTLAAGVAHEINNPIGGMQNAVLRLLQQPDLSDRQRTYLQLVQDGLARIARTTRRLLEFAPRDVSPRPFDLLLSVEGARALVEHRLRASRVALTVECDPDLPPVLGDAHELQQVLLNLFLNSLDAIEAGGGGRIAVQVTAADGRIQLKVSDDGPGMAAADLPRVFDPFFSRKDRPDASGLGMFISYSIIHSHGGEIRVESSPGQGFRTHITLPAAP